jgi:sigma-B regulation protein RsbU (phosphoserine phosphatase)
MGGPSGIVLGVIEGSPYSTETISLNHGDVVFLFTDGVTEAMNVKEEFFDDERLETILRGHRGESLAELFGKVYGEVEVFAGGAPQSDDVTVLAVRYR